MGANALQLITGAPTAAPAPEAQPTGPVSDIASTIAAPFSAVNTGAAGVSRLSLLGVVIFLIALWGAVRIAGFRFVIQTGVG